jgi:hypothetical protein
MTGRFNGTGVACGLAGVPDKASFDTQSIDINANPNTLKEDEFNVDRLMAYLSELQKELGIQASKDARETRLL